MGFGKVSSETKEKKRRRMVKSYSLILGVAYESTQGSVRPSGLGETLTACLRLGLNVYIFGFLWKA